MALAALLAGPTAVAAADLSFEPGGPPVVGGRLPSDGYRVPRWPVPPAPRRFDAYGYPVPGPFVAGGPSPLAVGSGCPAGLEPVYDDIGNFAGYAPVPLCR